MTRAMTATTLQMNRFCEQLHFFLYILVDIILKETSLMVQVAQAIDALAIFYLTNPHRILRISQRGIQIRYGRL